MIIAVIERHEYRSGVHSKCPVDTKRPSLTHVGRRLAMEEWPSISGVECGVHFEVRGSNIFFDEGGRAHIQGLQGPSPIADAS